MDSDNSMGWNKEEFDNYFVPSAFIIADKNRDKQISREEISLFSKRITPDQVDELFENYDQDSDGNLQIGEVGGICTVLWEKLILAEDKYLLTSNELPLRLNGPLLGAIFGMEVIKEEEDLAMQIFHDIDEDKSKGWNKDEFHTYFVRSLFIQLDKNNDEKLTREEIKIKSDEDFDAFMEKLDLNSDGSLDLDEFNATDTEPNWKDLTNSEENELSFGKIKPTLIPFVQWLLFH